MSSFIRKHLIIGSILLLFLYIFLSGFISVLISFLPLGDYCSFINEFAYIGLGFLLIKWFGFTYAYRKGNIKETFIALAFVIVTQIIASISILQEAFNGALLWKNPFSILLGFITLFEIAFLEESIFRGIIVNAFNEKYGHTKKGIWWTVCASGFIFGFTHLINYFAGVTFINTLIQSLNAIFIGIYFAAAYLRGRSLWALVIVHILINFNGLFTSLFTQNISNVDNINQLDPASLISGFSFLLISFYLLRDSKIKEIIRSNKIDA